MLDYDAAKGIQWKWQAVDGVMTKAPLEGEVTGPNPPDRAKRGTKYSMVVEGSGVPLGIVVVGAHRHDSQWLGPTWDAIGSRGRRPHRNSPSIEGYVMFHSPIRWAILFCSLTALLSGCLSGHLTRYTFHTTVDRIARPSSSSKQVSDSAPILPLPEGKVVSSEHAANPTFEIGDLFCVFSWQINDYGIMLTVKNKTGQPLQIVSEQAEFVDETGKRLALLVFCKLYELSPPQAVPPYASVRVNLFPKDYLQFHSANKFTERRALFDPPGFRVGDTPDQIIRLARENIGKTIQIYLPVEIGGMVYEYRFKFTITEVRSRPLYDTF